MTTPRTSRRTLLAGMAAAPLAAGLFTQTFRPAAHAAEPVVLVSDGQVRFQHWMAETFREDAQYYKALSIELKQLGGRITGLTMPPNNVFRGETWDDYPFNPDQVHVFVGRLAPEPRPELVAAAETLDNDGFLIDVTPRAITILGGSPWGTRFGVYEFMERYWGVSYLMSSPDGTDFEHRDTISCEPGLLISNPTFAGRSMYPDPPSGEATERWDFYYSPRYTWGMHARMHHPIFQNHYVGKLFDSAIYGDPAKPETYHPEFYPIRNGETVIPRSGSVSAWQPRFTEPGLVTEGIKQVIAYFDANPQRDNMSLAVNDSGGYSEDEVDRTKINSVGIYDHSDNYFTWANAVVAGVVAERPEYASKKFSAIAYRETNDPPAFDVHPQIVPYLVKETTGWLDPEFKAGQLAWIQQWADRANELAYYDYSYGAVYTAPRMLAPHLSEVYKTLKGLGVNYIFTETGVSFGEGPKGNTLAAMMWDVDTDPVAFQQEWLTKVAGPAAEPLLTEYFSYWEDVWLRRMPQHEFFASSVQQTYFNFNDGSYLECVDPLDFPRLRTLLTRAVTLAGRESPEAQARVQVIADYFDYYEAAANSYPRDLEIAQNPAAMRKTFLAAAAKVDHGVTEAERKIEVGTVLAGRSFQHPFTKAWERGQWWTGWNYSALWQTAQYMLAERPGWQGIRDQALELVETSDSARTREYAQTLLDVAAGRLVNVGEDPTFADPDLAAWTVDIGGLLREEPRAVLDHSIDGTKAIKMTGGANSGVRQTVPVTEGLLVQSVDFWADSSPVAQGLMAPWWNFYDADGAVIGWGLAGQGQRIHRITDRWHRIIRCERVPEGAATAMVHLTFRQPHADNTFYMSHAEFLQVR
ncbi:DUF4838 domain-containing protein [Propionibacteriaceae bacterium Y2011]